MNGRQTRLDSWAKRTPEITVMDEGRHLKDSPETISVFFANRIVCSFPKADKSYSHLEIRARILTK